MGIRRCYRCLHRINADKASGNKKTFQRAVCKKVIIIFKLEKIVSTKSEMENHAKKKPVLSIQTVSCIILIICICSVIISIFIDGTNATMIRIINLPTSFKKLAGSRTAIPDNDYFPPMLAENEGS